MDLLKKLKKLAILSSFLAMAGCAILPGMSMENPGTYNNSPPPDPITPTIVPITPALIAQVSPDLKPYHYRIGPGDSLNISAWTKTGVPVSLTGSTATMGTQIALPAQNTTQAVSLTNQAVAGKTSSSAGGYFVNSDGNVFIPILGNVHLAGLTEDETDTLLAQQLSVYVKNPVVQSTVVSFASQQVFVLGEMNSSGGSGGGATSSLTSLPIGGIPMTLATALAQTGGINLNTANTRLIYVIRQGSMTHPVVYWINMESPASMLYAENFPLVNNDVVYISTADITRLNRVLAPILSLVQTLWFTDSLVNGVNN